MTAQLPPLRRAAAIGMFDGVHTGHRHLFGFLAAMAGNSMRVAAVTFPNHPLEVIRPDKAPSLLSSPSEKECLLRQAGVEPLLIPFTPGLRALTASGFMQRLHDTYGVDLLAVGFNHRFGSDSPASFADYVRLGAEAGIEVVAAPELPNPLSPSATLGSSAIRTLLSQGNVHDAATLLGRNYTFSGTVVRGHRIGRTLGFPTANIAPGFSRQLIPARGVYAVNVTTPQGYFRAVANIGVRPTVSLPGDEPSVEIHIPGFSGDLYGQSVSVGFLQHIRNEMKFPSVEILKKQITNDISVAMSFQ